MTRAAEAALRPIPYGHQTIDAEDVRGVARTLRSDWMTQGPKIAKFEAAVAKECGAKYAVACANGTAALHLACLAAELGPGDEAITSPITFAATSNAALYCGAKPVFADVQPDTINIDPAEIAERLTSKTRAILPVHFSGHPCDLQEIHEIAAKRRLVVIEDAAQALGAAYRGEPIGSCRWSDMTTLSFHPVKHITTGEGGMVLTNRKDLYDRLRLFRTHGITRKPSMLRRNDGPWYYEMHALGFNYRITDFQCALGLSQLKKLPRFVARRRAIAAEYDCAFSALPEVVTPPERPYCRNSYHIYCIRLRDASSRRAVFERLQRRDIQANVHHIPVYAMPYYRANGYAKTRCPNAEDYYSRTITLPIYPGMTAADVKRVIRSVRQAVR